MLALFAFFMPGMAFADLPPPLGESDGANAFSLPVGKWSILITFIAPLVITVLKTVGPKFIEKIPKLWMPVAIGGIGLLLGTIDALNGGGAMHPSVGIAFAGLGVYLRELLDQLKKTGAKAEAGKAAAGAINLIACLALVTFASAAGCKTKDPVVIGQQIQDVAFITLDKFMKLEYQHRAYLKEHMPAVSKYADWLAEPVEVKLDHLGGKIERRPRGLAMIYSMNEARLAYKANSSPENGVKLQAAIALLQKTIAEVAEHTATINVSVKTDKK